MTAEEPELPLPPREPRSLFMHFAIVTAVVFLAIVLLLLILDVSIWIAVFVAVLIGTAAAPFTRRAEERALARRYEAEPGSPLA